MDKISDIIDEYINDLAIGISNLINIFEPDCIVIGGGFARYDYMLLDKLKGRLLNSNLLFNKRDDIVLRVAEFGNDAGIIGASQLWFFLNRNSSFLIGDGSFCEKCPIGTGSFWGIFC